MKWTCLFKPKRLFANSSASTFQEEWACFASPDLALCTRLICAKSADPARWLSFSQHHAMLSKCRCSYILYPASTACIEQEIRTKLTKVCMPNMSRDRDLSISYLYRTDYDYRNINQFFAECSSLAEARDIRSWSHVHVLKLRSISQRASWVTLPTRQHDQHITARYPAWE